MKKSILSVCLVMLLITMKQASAQHLGDGAFRDSHFQRTGNMLINRFDHAAILLPNGKVLIAGGKTNMNPYSRGMLSPAMEAELYDPRIGSFSPVGVMHGDHESRDAVALTNGNVLFLGRTNEIYDWQRNIFVQTGRMKRSRSDYGAILLKNGKVLVVGGSWLVDWHGIIYNTAELYDPKTGKFSLLPRPMLQPRLGAECVLLHDGRVLILGGISDYREGRTTRAEIFDPQRKRFYYGGTMHYKRKGFTATVLKNGNVLIAGGEDEEKNSDDLEAEIYVPSKKKFYKIAKLNFPRTDSHAVLLPDGHVLVFDGIHTIWKAVQEMESFNPQTNTFDVIAKMNPSRSDDSVTFLKNARILITGGLHPPNRLLNIAELFIYK